MSDEPARRERWPALFAQSPRALFVLNKSRRIRFVNAAWEKLTKTHADEAHGQACVRKGPTESLFRTLAPPPEAVAGRTVTVRRVVPPHRSGPPWWDVTFMPLGDGGFLGGIELIAASLTQPARSVPMTLGAARAQRNDAFPIDLFAAESWRGRQFHARVEHASASLANVWIVGEAGTGKSTLARVLHANGPHRDRAFVTIDCAGLQPYLIDGLLWGTGGLLAEPRIGTLHLKHPEAMPRDMQERLAGTEAEGNAPRWICTSVYSSNEATTAGLLFGDFALQASVLELTLAPLRERLADLPRILKSWTITVAADAMSVLQTHAWPGNLRELRSALPRPKDATAIARDALPRYLIEKTLNPPPAPTKLPPTLDEILAAVERNVIAQAMQASRGNQTDAAVRLGIARARLIRRLDALKLK